MASLPAAVTSTSGSSRYIYSTNREKVHYEYGDGLRTWSHCWLLFLFLAGGSLTGPGGDVSSVPFLTRASIKVEFHSQAGLS